MSRELKLIYGHIKYKSHGLKFASRRSLVNPDMFVVEYTGVHLATLRPVEYFNIKAASEIRMSRIEAIKNAKHQSSKISS